MTNLSWRDSFWSKSENGDSNVVRARGDILWTYIQGLHKASKLYKITTKINQNHANLRNKIK